MNLPKVVQYTGRLVSICWYVGELIVSNYVALSIHPIAGCFGHNGLVSCAQNVAQELLTIKLPTLKSVAIILNNIIYWYIIAGTLCVSCKLGWDSYLTIWVLQWT